MELGEVIDRAMESLGFEVVDWRLGNRHRLLQVFIDRPGGVDVDDCARASNHLARVLAVELDFDYDRLEVSSPGLDRVVRKPADFDRFAGSKLLVKLRLPVAGRRNFVGVLRGWQDEGVAVEVDGELHHFPLENIDKARLVPEW